MTIRGALDKINWELQFAEAKYPEWPDDPVHAVAIMVEEAGEAMQAALNLYYHRGSIEDLRNELAQTAAMAIRALTNL